MKKIPRKDLTTGSVTGHIVKLTIGMLGGFVGMCAFNLADTYFVSQLGKEYLAAMGFVGSIVMFVVSLSLGMGVAVAAISARKIGAKDFEGLKRFISDTFILAVLIAIIVAIVGVLSSGYILTALGAKGFVHELASRYINIWFCFIGFVFIPMLSNNAIRATGHALIPACVMGGNAILNIILDWLLIFGNLGFPRMGLEGAVWATVISRAFTVVFAVSLLAFKFRLISFARLRWDAFVKSCRELMATAIPAVGNNILMPLSNMLIIGMIAKFGTAAVAGANAGMQIVRFTFMLPMAMGSILMPFAGQNWAAGKLSRIREAWHFGMGFSLIYGVLTFIMLFWLGEMTARIFSQNPEVYSITVNYLFIILFFSGFCHIAVHTGFLFNAIGKPFYASVLYILRFALLMVPLAMIGMYFYGLNGIFGGVSISNLLGGIAAWLWFKRMIDRKPDSEKNSLEAT
jgi:putative MATE family efflux protein